MAARTLPAIALITFNAMSLEEAAEAGPVELGVRPRPLESFLSEFARAHRRQ